MSTQYYNKISKLYNKRNSTERNDSFFLKEPLTQKVLSICSTLKNPKILEVGCGNGDRLKFLKKKNLKNVYGVDPTYKKLKFIRPGYAHSLPFQDKSFDLLILGFCLYFVKPSDLIKTFSEIDRVLKDKSWLLIYDFYSSVFEKKKSHNNINIYKMDYTKMFLWHPFYKLESLQKFNYDKKNKWDENNKNLSTIICLRKKFV